MGLVRMGPPQKLIESLTQKFKIKNFVETGTYQGGTALWAANIFEKVLTIEKSDELYRQLVDKHGDNPKLELIFGDSREKLEEIIHSVKTPTVFWLDAHWSGGETYGETDQCPLLEEIEIIKSFSSDAYLLIDDARLFLSPPQLPHNVNQWPSISQIIETLHAHASDDYTVIIEDCIISVPSHAKPLLVNYCQAVNQKAWEEYGAALAESNFMKGVRLVVNSFKGKIKTVLDAKVVQSSS